MDADIEEIRGKYLNLDFDEKQFTIDPATTVEYARLCGETAERFLDAEHEEVPILELQRTVPGGLETKQRIVPMTDLRNTLGRKVCHCSLLIFRLFWPCGGPMGQ